MLRTRRCSRCDETKPSSEFARIDLICVGCRAEEPHWPCRSAREKAKYDAHIAKVVADAPVPTPEQLNMLARLLWPELFRDPAPHVPTERERNLSKLKDELAAARKRMDDALAGCHGCGLTQEAHAYQRGHGGYHEWVPLSPDDMIKTIRAHKLKLASIEKKIANLL